jgi:hypothetical protein
MHIVINDFMLFIDLLNMFVNMLHWFLVFFMHFFSVMVDLCNFINAAI